MWEARFSRITQCFSALALAGLVVVVAGSATAAQALPQTLWAVAVTRPAAGDAGWARLGALHANGINAIVVNGNALGRSELARLRGVAGRKKLLVVAGRRAGTTCATCLPTVNSPAAAVKLARSGKTVVARLRRPQQVHFLRGLRAGRVIAVVQLHGGRAFHAPAWKRVIQVARSDRRIDLAVTPLGPRAGAGLTSYLKLRTAVAGTATRTPVAEPPGGGGGGGSGGGGGGGGSDTRAPTTPGGLTVTSSTPNSVALSWTASTDDTRVASYGVYRNGTQVSTATVTNATLAGLTCATTYTLAVDAVDPAGNHSAKATVVGSTAACPPLPASNGTGNLWVDPNGGSCTRQATPGAWVDAAACGTFNAAYQAAQAGDVIQIRGGTYPTQNVRDRPDLPLGSAIIVFHPAPGENVTVNGSLELYGHDLIFDGGDRPGVNETNRVTVTGENAPDEESLGMRDNQGSQRGQHRGLVVEDVHIRNVKTSSDFSTLRYSEVGPSDLGVGNLCSDLVQSADEPTDGWVIEYNIVHDNKNDGCNGAHIDAFDVYVTNGVIRGNRIWWCGTQCIFTGDPSSILIENNMIEETNACGSGCDGPQELAVMGTTTVRYNTIEGDDGYGRDPDRPGNATIYGNLFLSKYNHCAGGGAVSASYDRNVFAPGNITCGTNSKACTPRLADGNLYSDVDRQADYHLAANDTCALGAGSPSSYPAEDIDEVSRPQGGAPDAGADER